MGNGNIDVGNKAATRKSGPLNSERATGCGAMTQQNCDSGYGNQSAPQKFVQLVGYRDPKTLPDKTLPDKTRPERQPIPVKR